MVEPSGMTTQTGDDLAQAGGSRQLAVEQGDQLAPGGQSPHPRIGSMLLDQPVEGRPRDVLQQFVKDGILVPHGVDLPLVSGSSAKRPEPSGINAVRTVEKKQT